MAIAPQYQNFNQPSYGQNYGQQQFNPVSRFSAPKQNRGFWGGLNDFLFGTPEDYNVFNRFDPQQSDSLSRLLSGGQNTVDNPYEGFEGLREETINDYYQNILPRLTEQFGASTNASPSSPAFHSALAAGGSGLAAMLNAQKSRYGLQNKEFGLRQQQLGLTPRFDIQRRERTPGFIQNAFGGITENADKIAKLLPFFL
jgi:hypothetical protein